jgi:transcriptional regulator with XRE-family HTH domain
VSHANYDYVKRNEFGDEFSYKRGTGKKSRWRGTRMCLGKREERVFSGDNREALEAWVEWTHECERDAPTEESTPVVPLDYRVKEEDLARGSLITEEVKADVTELLECGDMTQAEIADAFGISQSAVSRINKELSERRKRHEERQAVREEERRLRSEEREREKPEPLPDNFKPRVQERPARFFLIAEKGMNATLFSSRKRAEKVLGLINDISRCDMEVIECKFWDEG